MLGCAPCCRRVGRNLHATRQHAVSACGCYCPARAASRISPNRRRQCVHRWPSRWSRQPHENRQQSNWDQTHSLYQHRSRARSRSRWCWMGVTSKRHAWEVAVLQASKTARQSRQYATVTAVRREVALQDITRVEPYGTSGRELAHTTAYNQSWKAGGTRAG